ncbi:hypothetical protein P8452_65199 [Trifolium repens]|nr:hypothetical protein P8452_65199 [Trifolium repens]
MELNPETLQFPSLVSSLQKLSEASDYASINGILGTANSIYRKLGFHDHTDDQLLDLKFCLDNFTTPLLEIFLKTASLIDDAATPATDLRPLFEFVNFLCCKPGLVDLQSFFQSVILPELQSPEDVNGYPMLKADALKFFTMFLSQVSKHVAFRILPDLVRFLAAESNVVHSYAASCIEKLLSVKDEGGTQRYSSADISPIFTMLMNNLFSALKLPKSGENQYVMKCIMRVLGVADIQLDAAQICIEGLGSLLSEACQNPKNRVFNYYLFESVAIFVKRASERDPSIVTVFETKLFPRLEIILTNDGSEFQRQIFGNLLSPHSWRRASNVPVLVHLLHTFLQKAPNRISQVDRLTKVLGLFDKLIQSVQGFYVLNTVFESLEYGVIEPYISHIWAFIFRELQKRQTVKFLKSLLIFISLFLIKHGSSNVVDTMNTVQPDIFIGILTHFWIPNLKLITGDIELKLTAVASTRLICESPVLLDPAASVSWGKMVDSIVTLLSRPEQDTVEDKVDILDITVYSAGRKEDPIKDIRDPREFFVASLSRLSAKTPGSIASTLQHLQPLISLRSCAGTKVGFTFRILLRHLPHLSGVLSPIFC